MEQRTWALTEWEVAGATLVPQNVFSLARHGKSALLKESFDKGVDPDSIDNFGNSLLLIACQNNRKNIIRLCLKHGGDINRRNIQGFSGLHYARMYKYEKLQEYLISKGAFD